MALAELLAVVLLVQFAAVAAFAGLALVVLAELLAAIALAEIIATALAESLAVMDVVQLLFCHCRRAHLQRSCQGKGWEVWKATLLASRSRTVSRTASCWERWT